MVSIIIPTLNASEFLPDLLTRLKNQTVKEKEIIIIDSSSSDNTIEIANHFEVSIIIIPKEEFDHGKTRNIAAAAAKGDILVYLTQDVMPVDEFYLENLIKPLESANTVASYGKQLPGEDAIPPEKFARFFNYPDTPMIKTKKDIPLLGIKTFFFTNVCSAIKKMEFEKMGRFPENVIMNEDIVFAAKLILENFNIGYASNARVIHSHNYSLIQQFKRYFDIGIAFSRQKWFLELAAAEDEGFNYLKSELSYLLKERQLQWIPYVFAESIAKYAGYRLGLIEDKLPLILKKQLSMHRFFWDFHK